MPDKAWKKRERDVASYFSGTRTPLSGGNGKVTRADVIHEDLFIECKLRAKHTAVSLWDDTAKLAKEDPSSDVVSVYIEGPGGKEGIFTISSTPTMGFSNNDLVQKGIGRVSDSKNRATDALVGIGVSMSVVNEKKDVNEERDLAVKKLISSEKDLDYALAVTELSSEIIALEALQSSFAKISQMSLFDYLR